MKKLKETGSGSFRAGRSNGHHIKSIDLMGPTSNADSVMSQRMQYNVGNYDYDDDISYKGLGDQASDEFDDEEYEQEVDMEEIILECRTYKKGKYCLVETLDNLNEFPDYAGEFKHMMKKISTSAKERQGDIDEDAASLEEFSGAVAGGGGPALSLGLTAKGKKETPAQRKKRQNFNATKSFPYNKSLPESISKDTNMSRIELRDMINTLTLISESNIESKKISVDKGNINIDGDNYKVQANAGWKTAGQFIDVVLTSVKLVSNGLQVVGSAIGTSVNELVPTAKAKEINQNIESGKKSFTVVGKKATFKFTKIV